MQGIAQQLARMAEDKNSLSLTLSEVSTIDSHLTERWEVDFIRTDEDFKEVVLGSIPMSDRTLFEAEYEKAVKHFEKHGTEHTGFYDMMSNQPLLGISTSKRRGLVIDAISLAASIIKSMNINGDVVDVGCHAGVIPETLSKLVENNIDGIDPSKDSIKVAREETLENQRLNFFFGSVPFPIKKQYSFLLAVSSMPKKKAPRRDFLQGVSDLLEEGGVAMIVSSHWLGHDGNLDKVLLKQLQKFRLGFAFADVLGGYEDMPTKFVAEGCVVLVKGGGDILPTDLQDRMESDWPGFQEYANTPSTPARDKTQAFKRAFGKLV
ncbi:class I SAM-dependent methyltransferase [Halomonas sediminis]